MRTLSRVLASLLAAACSFAAAADTPFPTRPVTLVVPAPPGGATDALARTIAEEMARDLKQPVIVDNRPGAGGMLGAQAVARAAGDGHTILLTHQAPVLNALFMYSKMAYEPRRDLVPVTQVCSVTMVLAVHGDIPVRTVGEFVAWAAKQKGSARGSVSYGSFGVGSAAHLMLAYLSESRRLDMTHVAYKGEAPMVHDLVGKQIPIAMGSAGLMGPHIASGVLRPLAVIGNQRLPNLPEVPTLAQAGFDDPELQPFGWIVMMAPASVPRPVLERIETSARAAIGSAPVRTRMQTYGMEALGTSSAEFKREYDAALPVIEKLVRMSGAKAD